MIMYFGIIFAGGYNFDGDYNYYDSILEYDITGDEFREVGQHNMPSVLSSMMTSPIGAKIPSMI